MKSDEPTLILCGTDFSEDARHAANAAAALGLRLGASLLLVHAEGLPLEAMLPGDYDKLKSSVHDRLREEADRLRALGVIVKESQDAGACDDMLVQIAEQQSARLLMIPPPRLRAPARWLIGSVGELAAESSLVPTLVVRDGAVLEAWARGERSLKVFVATNFGASCDAALRWVSELRQIGPCEVIAAYVAGPQEEAARFGVPSRVGMGGSVPEMQNMLERDLREKVIRVLGEGEISVWVRGEWGDAESPLVDMAIEARADLLVVGTRHRRGLLRLRHGSVSHGILEHAPMNVACVPTPDAARIEGPRAHPCQRVLVAVDLNEPHGFAAPYGYGLVDPGGTVRLLHNIVPLGPNPFIGETWQVETEKEHSQISATSEEQLRALAPEQSDALQAKTEVEITHLHDTATAICTAAERFGADIVCIGSHTRPSFTAKVLGSISLAVLQRCRRPVLVVWPPAE